MAPGVIDVKGLLMAGDGRLFNSLMAENGVDLNPQNIVTQAANALPRYDFRALPVTDEHDIMLGTGSVS